MDVAPDREDTPPAAGAAGGLVPALHHAEEVMGTVVTLDLYGDASTIGPPAYLALARARALLHRIDAVFSTYKAHSPISALRRGEMTIDDAPAEVGPVLARCEQLRELTGGLFDPWAVPGGLDPSGYVKGWAAARALALLEPVMGYGAIVNAAGDIALTGAPAPGERWRIGIVDPAQPRRLLTVVEVVGAIATSGTYERGAHLIDPRRGAPATAAAAATVVGPDAGDVDALATALSVGGPDALGVLEQLPGYAGLVVTADGGWHHSPGFPFAAAEG